MTFRSPLGLSMIMTGSLLLLAPCGCASNVNDLLVEARRGDPESVKEAVVEIGRILEHKEGAGVELTRGDREGVLYLREVAQRGRDPETRASAISSLGRLEGAGDATDLFMSGLDDPFWVVRLEAARALSTQPAPRAVSRIAKRLDVEERPAVRVELIRALAMTGGDEALETLLRVFLDRSGRYRNMRLQAYEAVRAMTQESYDFADWRKWQEYYEARFQGDKKSQEAPPAEAPARSPAGKVDQS